MRKADHRSTTYVVYPAALLDGWEVVKEHDDHPVAFERRETAVDYAETQAVLHGGGFVKLENWYGDVERTWRVDARELPRYRGALAAG
jgi:hypothetical protein